MSAPNTPNTEETFIHSTLLTQNSPSTRFILSTLNILLYTCTPFNGYGHLYPSQLTHQLNLLTDLHCRAGLGADTPPVLFTTEHVVEYAKVYTGGKQVWDYDRAVIAENSFLRERQGLRGRVLERSGRGEERKKEERRLERERREFWGRRTEVDNTMESFRRAHLEWILEVGLFSR